MDLFSAIPWTKLFSEVLCAKSGVQMTAVQLDAWFDSTSLWSTTTADFLAEGWILNKNTPLNLCMIWTNKVQLFFLANTLLGENRKPHFNTRTLSKYQIQRFACLHTFNLTCFFIYPWCGFSALSSVHQSILERAEQCRRRRGRRRRRRRWCRFGRILHLNAAALGARHSSI